MKRFFFPLLLILLSVAVCASDGFWPQFGFDPEHSQNPLAAESGQIGAGGFNQLIGSSVQYSLSGPVSTYQPLLYDLDNDGVIEILNFQEGFGLRVYHYNWTPESQVDDTTFTGQIAIANASRINNLATILVHNQTDLFLYQHNGTSLNLLTNYSLRGTEIQTNGIGCVYKGGSYEHCFLRYNQGFLDVRINITGGVNDILLNFTNSTDLNYTNNANVPVFGDINNDGSPEVVFWNKGTGVSAYNIVTYAKIMNFSGPSNRTLDADGHYMPIVHNFDGGNAETYFIVVENSAYVKADCINSSGGRCLNYPLDLCTPNVAAGAGITANYHSNIVRAQVGGTTDLCVACYGEQRVGGVTRYTEAGIACWNDAGLDSANSFLNVQNAEGAAVHNSLRWEGRLYMTAADFDDDEYDDFLISRSTTRTVPASIVSVREDRFLWNATVTPLFVGEHQYDWLLPAQLNPATDPWYDIVTVMETGGIGSSITFLTNGSLGLPRVTKPGFLNTPLMPGDFIEAITQYKNAVPGAATIIAEWYVNGSVFVKNESQSAEPNVTLRFNLSSNFAQLHANITIFVRATLGTAFSERKNTTEQVIIPQCSDGLDNDNDTFIDFPNDPQCNDIRDNSESDAGDTTTTCSAGGGGAGGSIIFINGQQGTYVTGQGVITQAPVEEEQSLLQDVLETLKIEECGNGLDDDNDGFIDEGCDKSVQIRTDNGKNRYNLLVAPGGERVVPLIVTNLGTQRAEVFVSCEGSDACKYITITPKNVNIQPSTLMPARLQMTVRFPANLPLDEKFAVRILAQDSTQDSRDNIIVSLTSSDKVGFSQKALEYLTEPDLCTSVAKPGAKNFCIPTYATWIGGIILGLILLNLVFTLIRKKK